MRTFRSGVETLILNLRHPLYRLVMSQPDPRIVVHLTKYVSKTDTVLYFAAFDAQMNGFASLILMTDL